MPKQEVQLIALALEKGDELISVKHVKAPPDDWRTIAVSGRKTGENVDVLLVTSYGLLIRFLKNNCVLWAGRVSEVLNFRMELCCRYVPGSCDEGSFFLLLKRIWKENRASRISSPE